MENQLTARRGEPLSTGLGPLVVALGAVLPFTSTLYFGAFDPVAASMGLPFGTMLALHIVMDLLAVEMMLLALSARSLASPSTGGPSPATRRPLRSSTWSSRW
jgi:hypothetical protein